MDRETVEIYEAQSDRYEAQRTPRFLPQAEAFGRLVADGPVVDLGCGPGWYTAALGDQPIALDAAMAMLRRTREVAPATLAVQADLGALPFRSQALAGGWARNTYVHLRSVDLPMALADLHRSLHPDAPVELTFFGRPDDPPTDRELEGRAVFSGEPGPGELHTDPAEPGGDPGLGLLAAGPADPGGARGPIPPIDAARPTGGGTDREREGRHVFPGDDLPGRWFSTWPEDRLRDVIVGAGFELDELERRERDGEVGFTVRARRARTLPDTVGPGMHLLVSGLNPSLHAADAGVGFVTAGNRFWPAALADGLVTRDRDPRHALLAHGVGMTDLVKRATPRADALTRDEYSTGVARVERLCAWLRPAAVVLVGLAGWRAAVDRKATAGWQARQLGGTPVYVMPSTSGLNAATPLDALVDHLRSAAAGPPR